LYFALAILIEIKQAAGEADFVAQRQGKKLYVQFTQECKKAE